ncbi:retinol dehydrogenase 12-like [Watersipora subatra]|uniref:retinol dehydrogenase 12-like n=1 Tax=Watersipora subatra TaxID=2589382 RepID=UPI00355C32CB
MSFSALSAKIVVAAVSWFIVPVFLKSIVFKPPKCTSKRRLDGKVVMVTGANTGIGKVTAADLANRGALVYMACRNMDKASQAREDILKENPRANLKLVRLDLASLKSVRECADSFLKEESKLDILIENAGFGSLSHHLSEDDVELHMACNHLGHFYLTRLLLPALETSGTSDCKARIVVVSSRAHQFSPPLIDYDKLQTGKYWCYGYQQSKLANLLFVGHLNTLLGDKNVTVNALHPGTIRSDFWRNYLPNKLAYLFMFTFTFPFAAFTKTVLEGAQTQIMASVDESLEGVSGKYLLGCKIVSPAKYALDPVESEKLWRWSCSKTRLPLAI